MERHTGAPSHGPPQWVGNGDKEGKGRAFGLSSLTPGKTHEKEKELFLGSQTEKPRRAPDYKGGGQDRKDRRPSSGQPLIQTKREIP